MSSRKPAQDRKADIVSVLLDLADRIGPDRLTTNDIAREIGITQAAIFRHFPSKADLWVEVGEVIAKRLECAWIDALSTQTSPKERLRGLVLAQLRQIESTPAIPSILTSRELNADNAALRARFAELLSRFQGHLVTALQELVTEGLLNKETKAKDAAVLVTSLIQGVAIRWSLGSRGFTLSAEGLRLFDVLLGLLLTQGDDP